MIRGAKICSGREDLGDKSVIKKDALNNMWNDA